jgi:hypothetical protein
MDYSDYNGVIKKYNIDDSNVRKLNKDFNISSRIKYKKRKSGDFFFFFSQMISGEGMLQKRIPIVYSIDSYGDVLF